MPHQCLNCGETFADGSQDLLKGCPGCEGTRFFFTEEPLGEEEREELQEQTGQEVQEMLHDILDEAGDRDLEKDIWSREAWEDWIRLKTDDGQAEPVDDEELDVSFEPLTSEEEKDEMRASEAVQVSLEDVQEAEAPDPEPAANGQETEVDPAVLDETADAQAIEAATESDVGNQPSTLNIREPGQYEIDVQRLMEDSPVIVERDGSYVIHLPSVFERKGKKK